ncbi:MAG: peptidylprolyl isomerase [Candidatus Dormibacteria bacterium]
MARPTVAASQDPAGNLDTHKGYCAYINVAEGTLAIRLRPAAAPRTVSNFLYLAQHGYYDGTTVARACPDPADTGCFGQVAEFAADPVVHYTLPREVVKSQAKVLFGSVAMSSDAGAGSGGRFFISTGSNATLPQDYNLFGQVTDGLQLIPALRKGVTVNWVTVLEAPGTVN